jgi:hypothetical protein
MEMIIAQSKTKKSSNGDRKILAQHVIQSFTHGEVTPQKAHEIGKQFAEEFLGGRYKYVISTHIDKQHIHNHLIFATLTILRKRALSIHATVGKYRTLMCRHLATNYAVSMG